MKRRFKFTKPILDNISEIDYGKTYYDKYQPKLALRVSPKGKKSFMMTSKIHKKDVRRTLGEYPYLTIQQARETAFNMYSHIKNSQNSYLPRKKDLTFGTLFDLYKKRCIQNGLATKTIKEYDKISNKQIPFLSNCRVNEITKKQINTIRYNLKERILKQTIESKRTLFRGNYMSNRVFSYIRAIINFAISSDLCNLTKNPCLGIKPYPEEKKLQRFMEDEIKLLQKFAVNYLETGQRSSRTGFQALLFLLQTGLRKNEGLKLEISNIDFEQQMLRIPITKTGFLERKISQEALDIISQAIKEKRTNTTYVFEGKMGYNSHLKDLATVWKKVRSAPELRDYLRIHDLRHTYCTMAIENGVGIIQLKDHVGHKNIQTTMKYVHISDKIKGEACQKTQEAFNLILGNAT